MHVIIRSPPTLLVIMEGKHECSKCTVSDLEQTVKLNLKAIPHARVTHIHTG
jgi:hypothetical protein